ncbi:hypothetical protein BDY19DRAFT_993834 [Irpex rosettiformis]|uniref:Uncharacterized protein n=1 Tax=Irpex rosettiformis TaxID=378272 RepID=A0ACB8U430_9APHY|nr:hypothetical protein BDY19DRAFT_993834 [Irpex rosettiformis]
MVAVDLESFFGSFFIALCVVFMLYGLFCSQVFYYYTTYQDRLAIKFFVFTLLVLESLHAAACIHILYSYLIRDYTTPSKLENVVWTIGVLYPQSLASQPKPDFVSCIGEVPVGICSDDSVAKFSVEAAIETTRVALGFKTSSYVCLYHTWAAIAVDNLFAVILLPQIYVNATLSFNIFVDSSIAMIPIYYFSTKSRSSAHARSTKNILLKLMYYAITAGALTVLTSVIVLITYNKSTTTLTYSGFVQITAKLNANSTLAMLNARQSIMRRSISSRGLSLELSGLSSRCAIQPEQSMYFVKPSFATTNGTQK